MNFVGGDVPTLIVPLYPYRESHGQKTPLRSGTNEKRIDHHHQMQLLPFFTTEEQMILVVTDYVVVSKLEEAHHGQI